MVANAKADSVCQFTWADMLPKLAPIMFSQKETRSADL